MELLDRIPTVEDSIAKSLNRSNRRLEPEIEEALLLKLHQHKWLLSEKMGRDVGIEVAYLDFIKNVEPLGEPPETEERIRTLEALGAQMENGSIWETISPTQPPKQIVQKRIILPLTMGDLAHKHGVVTPKTIIFFGPPGTGKTYFVRGIAGVLGWWYVEISPSTLIAGGENQLAASLRGLMEKVRTLDETIVFIDEFEELAGNRERASLIEKSITNEFLKQVPLLKKQDNRVLLVCATNHIRLLDPALLRPGRFDCIIPVGDLDESGRETIFRHYLSETNQAEVDVKRIVSMIPRFTPADIEYLFQKVRQEAFERELIKKTDYRVTTDIFLEMIPEISPTLTDAIIRQFEEDCERYARY